MCVCVSERVSDTVAPSSVLVAATLTANAALEISKQQINYGLDFDFGNRVLLFGFRLCVAL